MRILSGPEHDACHVDPSEPGGYEWWYFDAFSDDGNWMLVAIYFLGTPMSPYYKAVVNGARPRPSDWCAVFFSVHEKVTGTWKERSYAYNIYRGGLFSERIASASVGRSSMRSKSDAGSNFWNLQINEGGLWRGKVTADLRFTSVVPGNAWAIATEGGTGDGHTWVCAAPLCRAEGSVTLPNGRQISFVGNGYHDHNFGMLPYRDIDIWYWGRSYLRATDGELYLAIYYDTEFVSKAHQTLLVVWNSHGVLVAGGDAYRIFGRPLKNAYGLGYSSLINLGAHGQGSFEGRFVQARITMRHDRGLFSDGPFYRRLPFSIELKDARRATNQLPEWAAEGEGVCEVFQPRRLCGPIASRALWSRMRRRNQ